MLGLIILRLDPIILKGMVVLNVVSGLDPIILNEFWKEGSSNVHDVVGIDPVIMKGRIIQDVSSVINPVIPKGRIVLNVVSGIDLVILKGRII